LSAGNGHRSERGRSSGAQALPRDRGELAAVPASDALHVCPSCQSDLVQPVDWDAVDMVRWRVVRRCPECEWQDADVHDQETLDRYDLILDAATHALAEDLAELERENMEHDCELFAGALRSDAILPEDF
jgi:hypothetical protein